MPVERDLLQIYVKGEVIKGALNFKIFTGIPSYPHEFLDFSDSITSFRFGILFVPPYTSYSSTRNTTLPLYSNK